MPSRIHEMHRNRQKQNASYYGTMKYAIYPIQMAQYMLQNQLQYTQHYEQLFTEYQTTILGIIQSVIDRINLDIVIRNLETFVEKIQKRTDISASDAFGEIESIILGIITNITQRVPLQVVLQRFAYLQEMIASGNDIPIVKDAVQQMILDIISTITNREYLPNIIAQLEAVEKLMGNDWKKHTIIEDIENIILGIIANITQRVPLTVVLGRFDYLTQKVDEMTKIMIQK